jgi:hypothetical protein
MRFSPLPSALARLSRSVFELKIGDQKQIDHIQAVVWLDDDNRATAWYSHELPAQDGYLATIREMDHKWLER